MKKQPIKNLLGKGKSSFEFDLYNFDSDRGYRDSPDYSNFYHENRLEKMHVAPIEEGRSVKVREPHLGFNYRYSEGESSHEPHRHTDSYAGEMIDDENTLSKFIAPPVFENHQSKVHEQQTTKILYGTPEAQNLENANTKSLLESLNSLMSPLAMSNEERKSLGDFESNSDGGNAKAKDSVEYGGKYKVVNEQAERESDEYKHGNEDEKRYSNSNGNNYERDHGDYYNENKGGLDEESTRHFNNADFDRNDEGRQDRYNERMDDSNSRNYEGNKYDDPTEEDRDRFNNAETRSSENHEASRYDDEQSYDNEKREEGNENEKSINYDQGGDKPIEVVQDDSGKLHPMSNNISKEELNNEVDKYVNNLQRNENN